MARHPTRREWLRVLSAFGLQSASGGEPSRDRYSFWVLGLLRPSRLHVSGIGQARLHCQTARSEWIVEPGLFQSFDNRTAPARMSGPGGSAVTFRLEAPGELSRIYHGTLEVSSQGDSLSAVLTTDCELAVGSIVGAEIPALRGSLDVFMAQAVLARSFLMGTAAPRHRQAFFCDTTHCQFLRSPARPGSLVASSVAATNGIVLRANGSVIPACYSAACGGTTEAGERDGYRYRSVECKVCRDLRLPRRGHGWGLCQEGAIGLARRGYSWQSILRQYFPDASLE